MKNFFNHVIKKNADKRSCKSTILHSSFTKAYKSIMINNIKVEGELRNLYNINSYYSGNEILLKNTLRTEEVKQGGFNNQSNLNKSSNKNIYYTQIRSFSTSNTNTNNNNISSTETKHIKKNNKQAKFSDLKQYFYPYFKQRNKTLILALAITVVSKAIITISPYFLKLMVEAIIAHKPIALSLALTAAFGVFRTFGSTLLEFRQVLLSRIANDVILNFNKDMLNYLFKIDYKHFKTNSTHILNSFNKSNQGIDNLNRFIFASLVSTLIEVGVVTLTLYYFLGLKYCINTIVTYGVYFYLTKKIVNYRMPIMNKKNNNELAAEGKLAEVVYNIDNVKYFQQEKRETDYYQSRIKSVRKSDIEVIKSLVLLNSIQAAIISLGTLGGLTMAVFDCYNGKMSPGDILMLQTIFAQIMQPLFFVGTLMKGFAETKVKLNFAVETIKDSKKLDDIENKHENELKEFVNQGCNLKFDNVWFTYYNKTEEDNSIMNNVDIHQLDEENKKLSRTSKLEKDSFNNNKEILSDLKSTMSSISRAKEMNIETTKETANTDLNSITNPLNNHHHTDNKYILREFTAEFPKGQFTALVGKSGQGKSTIFNLIVSLFLFIIIINILFSLLILV